MPAIGGEPSTASGTVESLLAEGPPGRHAVCLCMGLFPPFSAWASATWWQLCCSEQELSLSAPVSLWVSEKLAWVTASQEIWHHFLRPPQHPSPQPDSGPPAHPLTILRLDTCSSSMFGAYSGPPYTKDLGKWMLINRHEFISDIWYWAGGAAVCCGASEMSLAFSLFQELEELKGEKVQILHPKPSQ